MGLIANGALGAALVWIREALFRRKTRKEKVG